MIRVDTSSLSHVSEGRIQGQKIECLLNNIEFYVKGQNHFGTILKTHLYKHSKKGNLVLAMF
jgi:hypothetical protein